MRLPKPFETHNLLAFVNIVVSTNFAVKVISRDGGQMSGKYLVNMWEQWRNV